jgi:hypothetical protein
MRTSLTYLAPAGTEINSAQGSMKKIAVLERVHDQVVAHADIGFLCLQTEGTTASTDHGNTINRKDCSDLLSRLAAQSTIHPLSTLDGNSDSKNLSHDVDGVSLYQNLPE